MGQYFLLDKFLRVWQYGCMDTKDYILVGRAQELADRFSTTGSEELLTEAIVALVQEYIKKATHTGAGVLAPRRRPNCF